ncbi:hypothetical protein PG994_007771 [Apiospora phragmitis]|uniref:Uncharacterized protein n=1 Tax=Apiospora phragmitis TaxID=2905665 RepID=A0ABR1UR54_9PEZI
MPNHICDNRCAHANIMYQDAGDESSHWPDYTTYYNGSNNSASYNTPTVSGHGFVTPSYQHHRETSYDNERRHTKSTGKKRKNKGGIDVNFEEPAQGPWSQLEIDPDNKKRERRLRQDISKVNF